MMAMPCRPSLASDRARGPPCLGEARCQAPLLRQQLQPDLLLEHSSGAGVEALAPSWAP